MLSLLIASVALSTTGPADLVDVAKAVPGVVVDLRYATTHNFMHRKLYPVARCLLARDVARRLALVQSDLARQGLSLKVWDAYRPLSVAKRMWELVRDSRYVANPAHGRNTHCRGAAVDVTLVDRKGRELPMPSGFDEFGPRAWRSYRGGSATSRANRRKLERAMVRRGFKPLATEWWHFDVPDWRSYPERDVSPASVPVGSLFSPSAGTTHPVPTISRVFRLPGLSDRCAGTTHPAPTISRVFRLPGLSDRRAGTRHPAPTISRVFRLPGLSDRRAVADGRAMPHG